MKGGYCAGKVYVIIKLGGRGIGVNSLMPLYVESVSPVASSFSPQN